MTPSKPTPSRHDAADIFKPQPAEIAAHGLGICCCEHPCGRPNCVCCAGMNIRMLTPACNESTRLIDWVEQGEIFFSTRARALWSRSAVLAGGPALTVGCRCCRRAGCAAEGLPQGECRRTQILPEYGPESDALQESDAIVSFHAVSRFTGGRATADALLRHLQRRGGHLPPGGVHLQVIPAPRQN